MKRALVSEEKIISILNETEAGAKVTELCRRHGISDATFYMTIVDRLSSRTVVLICKVGRYSPSHKQRKLPLHSVCADPSWLECDADEPSKKRAGA
jgi:hypothetical protein